MAREVIIRMTNDFDRSQEADEVVTFVWDGYQYEIDSDTKHAEEFREFIQTWIDVAHEKVRVAVEPKGKATGGSKPGHTKAQAASPPGESLEQRRAIRKWAAENGYKTNLRGLISQQVRDAYTAATGIEVKANVKANGGAQQHPDTVIDQDDPRYALNVNGVSQDMREWAKGKGIPIARGYLKREYRDMYYQEQAQDAEAMTKLNGAHV